MKTLTIYSADGTEHLLTATWAPGAVSVLHSAPGWRKTVTAWVRTGAMLDHQNPRSSRVPVSDPRFLDLFAKFMDECFEFQCEVVESAP